MSFGKPVSAPVPPPCLPPPPTPPPPPLPPLPRTLRSYVSYRQSSSDTPILVVDSQQHRRRDAVHHQAAAAETEERQGQPLGRQHAHVHADVDHRLHAQPHADS